MDIKYVKKVTKEKKITQLELSKLAGVPIQTIQNIFSGNTQNPRIDTVEAIEKALGINQTIIELPKSCINSLTQKTEI